jgi:hypothetical protein
MISIYNRNEPTETFSAYKYNIFEDRDSLGVLNDEDGNKNYSSGL